MFYGGSQAVEIKIKPNALHQSVHLTFQVYRVLPQAIFPWPAKIFSADLNGLYEPFEFELAVRQEQ